MATKRSWLRDSTGFPFGYIDTHEEDGRQVLHELSGKILGFYYPKRDVTTDLAGMIVGRGNILGTLITPPRR